MEKNGNDNKIIKKPKVYIFTAILWILSWSFLLTILIMGSIENNKYYLFPVFIILFLSIINALFIILYAINFSIEISDDKVIIKNLFRKKRIYNINDLNIKWKIDSFIVYKENSRLARVCQYDANFDMIKKIKVKW